MRIVLDVGTSLAWCRPPVGIVRAEQRFAAFLLERRATDVLFCRYDRALARHVEVPVDAVRSVLERGGADRSVLPPPQAPPPDRPAERIRLGRRLHRSAQALAERSLGHLPAGIRPEAALVARNAGLVVKSAYWLTRKAVRELVRSPIDGADFPPVAPMETMPDEGTGAVDLTPDDVYVSMGLDWDYNDLPTLHRFKRARGFRAVLYCHDLIPVRFPHLMSFDARGIFSRHFVDVAHTADVVVAVSRASRDDYREFLASVGAPVPPISIVHNGSDIAVRAQVARQPPRADLMHRPFVLCVGTLEARKNHALLYHVWDRLAARHGERTPLLVLVGMMGWGVQDLLGRMRTNPRLADHIVLLDEVSDEGLVWLYEHCLFTVYPSFVEGSGLPVAESLTLEKPCITSNAPSIVEATRGLVPALDPLDVPAWLSQVERYALDAEARRAAAQRLRGYRPHTWRDHGEAMLALIDELAGTRACASCI